MLMPAKPRFKAAFVTVLPSPYQRDLFAALAMRDEVELRVYYVEEGTPENPWPRSPLRPYERILPGIWIPFSGAHLHLNWGLPDLSDADFIILSVLYSFTGQWLVHYTESF
jgi:hypothetical protein